MTDKKLNKENSVWVWLENSLNVLSSTYDQVSHLNSPIFDVLDELDTAITVAFDDKTLKLFLDKQWITNVQYSSLVKFKNHVDKIPEEDWNEISFDTSEDWLLTKKWAKKLKVDLAIDDNDWDSNNDVVIWNG